MSGAPMDDDLVGISPVHALQGMKIHPLARPSHAATDDQLAKKPTQAAAASPYGPVGREWERPHAPPPRIGDGQGRLTEPTPNHWRPPPHKNSFFRRKLVAYAALEKASGVRPRTMTEYNELRALWTRAMQEAFGEWTEKDQPRF